MSNELALNEVMTLGKALAESGYFSDVKQASQAVVKILAGKELGIGPVAAMSGLYIVKGKVTLSANIMASLIKASQKYNYEIKGHSDKACVIEFFEDGQSVGVSEYTLEDAGKAKLTGKDNWKQFPQNMLFARALSNGFKWFCPDLANGQSVYTPDEIEAEGLTVEMPELIPATSEVERDRDDWIDFITDHDDFPFDGMPKDKVDFINAQFTERSLDLSPITIPEVIELSK